VGFMSCFEKSLAGGPRNCRRGDPTMSHTRRRIAVSVTLYGAPLGYHEGALRKTRYRMNSSVKVGRRLKNN